MAGEVVPPMPALAPPGIGGLRVLAGLRRNALGAFPETCRDGAVLRPAMPPLAPALVLAGGPDAMRQVLQADAASYVRLAAGRRVLGPIVGRGLLTSEGDTWRRQRLAMAPAFTPRTVPVLAQHVARCAERACRELGPGRVDMLAAMQRLALDIAASSMFALETAEFGDELRAMVTSYMAELGRLSLGDFLLPGMVPTPLRLRRAAFRRRWRRLIEAIVAERRRNDLVAERRRRDLVAGGEHLDAGHSPAPPRDLFDLMASAHGGRDEALLADEAATMIVAGHETTALALFWALHLLAQAPSWQDAVAEEARGRDLSPEGAADALEQLPVARAVVQEALRLYPPAFMTARQARVATRIGEVPVPRGAVVLLAFWLLHRDRGLWGERADTFDPARFLEGSAPERFAYLPFGAGPHVCIGAQLAMTEAVLVLARLLRDARVSLEDDAALLPVGILSTRPERAPTFRVQARLS